MSTILTPNDLPDGFFEWLESRGIRRDGLMALTISFQAQEPVTFVAKHYAMTEDGSFLVEGENWITKTSTYQLVKVDEFENDRLAFETPAEGSTTGGSEPVVSGDSESGPLGRPDSST